MTPEEFAEVCERYLTKFVRQVPYPESREQPLAIITSRAPPKSMIGGSTDFVFEAGVQFGWQPLGHWYVGDGIPARGTIVLTMSPVTIVKLTPSMPLVNLPGFLAKITTGGRLGSFVQYTGFPAIVPFASNVVDVSVLPVTVPYTISAVQPTQGKQAQYSTAQLSGGLGAIKLLASCKALVIDDWADFPPPQNVVTAQPCYAAATAFAFSATNAVAFGPMEVASIALANLGSNPVIVLIGDVNGGDPTILSTPDGPIAVVEVPANTTVGIGASVLGPVAGGIYVQAVTAATYPGAAPYTADPNGATVLATISANVME